MNKLVLPKVVSWVFDELDKSDEEAPGMRTVNDQSLQQDSRDLLLYGFSVGLGKEGEEGAAEVVGVAIGIAKLIGYCIQEEIST